jgi:hypothetical protein
MSPYSDLPCHILNYKYKASLQLYIQKLTTNLPSLARLQAKLQRYTASSLYPSDDVMRRWISICNEIY